MQKLILSFLFLALLLTACTGATTPTPSAQPVTEVESSSSTITAEGKLLPSLAIELAFAQGGVIAEVLVKPGDTVTAGDVLARLIGFEIAQADLAVTQAQYDQVYNTALAQEKSTRTQDWYKSQPGDFTLPLWYYDQQEQLHAAQSAVEKAEDALSNAQARLADVVQTTGADFVKVEADLNAAQADYQVAKNLNDRLKNGVSMDEMTKRQLYLLQRDAYLKSKGLEPRWVNENNIDKDMREEAQDIFDDAESTLEDAQNAYDDAVSTDGAKDILKARAQVSVAQERYYTALDYVHSLQTGLESQSVSAAQTMVNKAKAALELYELRTPISGTVLSSDLKAGQAAAPGLPVVFLADTTAWTVETKDLAEIDIAHVALGQSVTVKLDAFPGEEFSAKVTAIDPVGKEYLGDMTYKVTITLNGSDPRFMWNMTATVTVNTAGK
jgi:multidrug efflux pump subunit AcrA (membrane-fusion protein)